jgi:hypothetical protein
MKPSPDVRGLLKTLQSQGESSTGGAQFPAVRRYGQGLTQTPPLVGQHPIPPVH